MRIRHACLYGGTSKIYQVILLRIRFTLDLHAVGPGFDSRRGRSFFGSVLGAHAALSLLRTIE
jgi:hypothetical protein